MLCKKDNKRVFYDKNRCERYPSNNNLVKLFFEADYLEEHIAILNERWKEMNKPDAHFYTLEDVSQLLNERNKQ